MNTGIQIRPMIADDLDAVIAMERETPEAPQWTREDYLRYVGASENSRLQRFGLVAELQGRVAGFAVLDVLPPVAELTLVVVDAKVRRSGIGSKLVALSMVGARGQGARRLELEVRQSNRAAIAMYERAGLCRDGRRPAYYSAPVEDAVLMSVTL